jgi:hypothetical protein
LFANNIPTINQKKDAFQVVKKLPVDLNGQASRKKTNISGINKYFSGLDGYLFSN